jgi:hypothetical protein
MTRRPSALAQIVRVYADAVRLAFGEKLDDPHAAEFARLMISLADSVADCAEATARTYTQIAALADTLGLEMPPLPPSPPAPRSPSRPRLRVVDGH